MGFLCSRGSDQRKTSLGRSRHAAIRQEGVLASTFSVGRRGIKFPFSFLRVACSRQLSAVRVHATYIGQTYFAISVRLTEQLSFLDTIDLSKKFEDRCTNK